MSPITLTYILSISIGVIMFGIGLNLKPVNFKRVFIAPKAVLIGLSGQMILLPAVGFLIAWLAPIDPVFKLGIILISACPGGTSSNIVTYMLAGRVALSVSMTAFNSFLIIVTIPFILDLGFTSFINDRVDVALSFGRTIKEVSFTVLLPILAGMWVDYNFSKFTSRLKIHLRYILPLILLVVFTLVILNENQNGEISLGDYGALLVPALILNLVVMFMGYFLSSWSGITHRGSYTIAIEMGLQNSALAIFIANNVLKMEGLAVIAVLYGGFSFFSTLIVAFLIKRFLKKKEA